mgnify:CR=1 FL=1
MSNKKRTTEDFISLSKIIHNNKYTYEYTKYINSHTKVIITCPFHGNFEQSANSHLRGNGCQKCWTSILGKLTLRNRDKVIEYFINRHGTNYDYSKVNYINDKTKVIVICKIHGEFSVSPNNHTKGRGCPNCAVHGYRKNKPGNFYILQNNSYIKVGITNNSVKARVNRINKSSGLAFRIVEYHYFENGYIPYEIESKVLKLLKSKYKSPEEIFDGSTETFIDVNLNELKSHLEIFLSTPTTKEN